jgi:16S rRNA (guanine966-N2)-methyltransferase
MRIVGGESRGRALHSVAGEGTRPTADRVRQSLFDRLGQRCDGLSVLDLYAGTGALSFEALSRGAVRAVLVEQAKPAVEVIELNARELGMHPRCKIIRDDVVRALPQLAARAETFDLIFSDPPYALQRAQSTIDRIAELKLLSPAGRAVIERDKHEPSPQAPPGLLLVHERNYGDTAVSIFEHQAQV